MDVNIVDITDRFNLPQTEVLPINNDNNLGENNKFRQTSPAVLMEKNPNIQIVLENELFQSLKLHIDSQNKLNEINQSRIRSYERFRKYCQRVASFDDDGMVGERFDQEQFRNEYNRFDRNYRHWRKRIRKLRKETNSSLSTRYQNPYDTLYELFVKIESFDRSTNSKDKLNVSKKPEDQYLPNDKLLPDINVIEPSASSNNISINNRISTSDKSIQCNSNDFLDGDQENIVSEKHSPDGSDNDIPKTRTTRGRKAKTPAKKQTTQTKKTRQCKVQNSRKDKIKKTKTSTKAKTKSLAKRKKVVDDDSSTDLDSSSDFQIKEPPAPPKKKRTRRTKKESAGAPRVYQCETEGCPYSTTNSWNMNLHRRTHSNERPFKCDKCEVAFKIKGDLKVHQNIHEGKRFECTFEGCAVSYATRKGIRKHIQIFHTKEQPLIHCNWEGCNYTTYRNEYLKIHRKVHTGERPFKCAWPDCDQAFKSSSNLWSHKMKHQNESRFKCSFSGCNYITYTAEYLQNHQVVHTGEKPYKCVWPKCGHAFKTLSSLSSHKMIHENERRYKCSFEGCDFLDNLLANLRKHEETKHGKKNTVKNIQPNLSDSGLKPESTAGLTGGGDAMVNCHGMGIVKTIDDNHH